MHRLIPSLAALGCATLSGALLFLSTENGHVWPLAWIAVVPLLWLAYGDVPAWQLALASFVAYLIGAVNLYQAYGTVIFALAPYLPLLAAAFAACIIFARFAFRRAPRFAWLVAFPAAWTTVEYVTTCTSPNGSYLSWAYSQSFVPVLNQSASLFGIWSVTFLLATVNNAVAMVIRDPRRALPAALPVAVLFVANVAFGVARLAAAQGAGATVALLTDDALPFAQTEPASMAVSREYASFAAQLLRRRVAAVVLPEKTVMWEPSWDGVVSPYRDLAAKRPSEIVVGFEEHGSLAQNVALTFASDGAVHRYAKQHLIAGFERLIPGRSPGLLPNHQAVEICKDMDYPATVRADARAGDVEIMYVAAWDFVRDEATHAGIAIMRGVENGFAVVRSARNGLMTVSDAQGRIIAEQPSRSDSPVYIVATVARGPGTTLYARIGDVFAWLCAVATVALALMLGLVGFEPTRNQL